MNSLAQWCSSRPLANARGLLFTPKLPPKACLRQLLCSPRHKIKFTPAKRYHCQSGGDFSGEKSPRHKMEAHLRPRQKKKI